MRPLFACLAAAAILTANAAQAIQCAKPPEKAAFDVEGLKSELMVTAISCQAQDRYNAFVTRYRPDLVSQERAIDVYFRRSYGRSAQKQHDDYITLLANAQSDEGIKLGTLFCMKSVGLFDEVMALKDDRDLPNFATGKALPQPIVLLDCPAPKTRVKVTRTAKK
jgi:hypothetical protein